MYKSYCEEVGQPYSYHRVASTEVRNYIVKLMHERGTRYRWMLIFALGASINSIVNYTPAEGIKNNLPHWKGFFVKDR